MLIDVIKKFYELLFRLMYLGSLIGGLIKGAPYFFRAMIEKTMVAHS
jgi:hypothetical protein